MNYLGVIRSPTLRNAIKKQFIEPLQSEGGKMKAVCFAVKDYDDEWCFHAIVFLTGDETPKQIFKKMFKEGDVPYGAKPEDVKSFYMDPDVARTLKQVKFPDYVADDDVGDIMMKRLFLEVCKAFKVKPLDSKKASPTVKRR